MAHRNEKFIRHNNPEHITGVSDLKVNSALASITHRNGQVGKTKMEFTITIRDLFSVKEIQTLAHKLMMHHRLSFRPIHIDRLW